MDLPAASARTLCEINCRRMFDLFRTWHYPTLLSIHASNNNDFFLYNCMQCAILMDAQVPW